MEGRIDTVYLGDGRGGRGGRMGWVDPKGRGLVGGEGEDEGGLEIIALFLGLTSLEFIFSCTRMMIMRKDPPPPPTHDPPRNPSPPQK